MITCHTSHFLVQITLPLRESAGKRSDREAVETLTATLTITEDMASDSGLLTAARFQWLTGKDS